MNEQPYVEKKFKFCTYYSCSKYVTQLNSLLIQSILQNDNQSKHYCFKKLVNIVIHVLSSDFP